MSDMTIAFDSYSDLEVLYMGVPYPRSKLVEGRWYFRRPGGEYRPFPFQSKVRYCPAKRTFTQIILSKKKRTRGRGQREVSPDSPNVHAARSTTPTLGPVADGVAS